MSPEGISFCITWLTAFHPFGPLEFLISHPVRSWPLNSAIEVPHFTFVGLGKAGARTPTHESSAPSSLIVEPSSLSTSEVRRAEKDISDLDFSNWAGSEKVSRPSSKAIFLIGRALPKRPTNRPDNSSPWLVISSHDGYALSPLPTVKSHLPVTPWGGLTDIADPTDRNAKNHEMNTHHCLFRMLIYHRPEHDWHFTTLAELLPSRA